MPIRTNVGAEFIESGRPRPIAEAGGGTDDLWRRVELLRPEERLLVELSVRGGRSSRQIAELLQRDAGTVSRTLHRIGKRLHDPLVIALLDPKCPLEGELRQVGVEHLLVGLSAHELAKKYDLSAAEVRRRIALVRFWFHGERGRGKEPGDGNQRRRRPRLIPVVRLVGGDDVLASGESSGRNETRNHRRPSSEASPEGYRDPKASRSASTDGKPSAKASASSS